MTDSNNDDNLTTDELNYRQSQTKQPQADPLAEIKAMRLQQLAVCKLKTAKEMQAMTAARTHNSEQDHESS
ncbi:hypothetical protein [Pseudoalteromonas sp.]|uniref:hypothetical protein n=1 Tax=Pseudoalteromonas sp. TaxID=53249 RepID=UPI00356252C5